MMDWQIGVALVVAIVLTVVLFKLGGRPSAAVRTQLYSDLDAARGLLSGDASARKDAIIRLDTILGKSLQYAGINGDTVGERLKQARSLFDRKVYDDIWTAHKLRNRLVHEQYEVGQQESERAASVLSSAVRRLLK